MTNRKAMSILLLVVFVDMVGFGIIIPFLPFWAERFGASAAEVTLLMSVYALCQFLFAIPLGAWSDRIGRKPVLLLSIAGSILSSVILAFADALWVIFAARAVAGIMAANLAVAHAYVADVTTPENRAKGMGLMGATFGVGFIFGPALGGFLAGTDAANPNYQLTFLVAAGLAALSALGGLLFLPESPRQRDNGLRLGLRVRIRAFSDAVRVPSVAGPIVVALVVSLAMTVLESTYPLWTNRAHGWGPRENGWFFAYIGVVLVIVQGGLVGRLIGRFGEIRVLAVAIVVLGVGMALTPASLQLWVLFISGGAIAIGYGLAQPSLNTLASKSAPAEIQGSIMGALQSSQSLARMIGPALAGILFQDYGRDTPYFVGAVLLALSLFLVAFTARRRRQESA